jgi:hypothetical protein
MAALSDDVAQLLAVDARAHVFMIQALLRLYEDCGKAKDVEKRLKQVKELEDALGAVTYANDMQAAGAKADPKKATQALLDVLHDGWLTGKRARQLTELFSSMDVLHDVDKDRAFVKTALAALAKKIEKADLDMNDLEEGIHELRRKLRWLPITMMALDGLVVLDPSRDPLPELAALKQLPIATSRFGMLPKPEANGILLPQSLFLELSRVIAALGDIKDRGQKGEAKGEPDPTVHKDAHALDAALKKQGLLSAIRTSFV